MPNLSFKMTDIEPILDEIKAHQDAGKRFIATTDMLFNKDLHKDGVLRDQHGKTEAEAKRDGDPFWPSKDNMLQDKIGPVVRLVGDMGCYLISNCLFEEEHQSSPAKRGTIAYAKGCNPNTDADWYEHKRAKFGGDDGVVDLPLEWFTEARSAGAKTLTLRLNKNSISLVTK